MNRNLLVAGLLALFALAGCSGAPPASVPATVPPVCVAIAAVYAQIDALEALDPATATAADVDDAVNNLASSWINLRAQAQAISQQGYTALDDAINRLTVAAAALPNAMPPAEKLASLEEEIDDVVEASELLKTELGCPDL